MRATDDILIVVYHSVTPQQEICKSTPQIRRDIIRRIGIRYYSPSLGRWTQQDPVGGSLFEANELNRYTFVGDDPLNQVNPSGQAPSNLAVTVAIQALSAGFHTDP